MKNFRSRHWLWLSNSCFTGFKGQVYSIERQKELYLKTKKLLPKLGYPCMFLYGDGLAKVFLKWHLSIKIDTCSAPFIPEDLLAQLKVEGV